MRSVIFNSQGLESLLHLINPNGSPDGSRIFPQKIIVEDTKYSNSFQNTTEWLTYCVDNVLDGDIEKFMIEDNIGVFLEVAWSNTSNLEYANIQVIISRDTDLITSYCNKLDNCDYLRFDMDLNKCGPLLKEPMPHIHCKGKDEPRFPFYLIDSENLIIDFFSLIFRNYFYDKWHRWLRAAYSSSLHSRFEEDDLFDVISEAYKCGKINIINEVYLDKLHNIKKIANSAVDDFFRMHLNQVAKNLFI